MYFISDCEYDNYLHGSLEQQQPGNQFHSRQKTVLINGIILSFLSLTVSHLWLLGSGVTLRACKI